MPSDMLTLILVMSMGALGGTLHLTRIYFLSRMNAANVTIEATASYYLFRPFLGAITALSVFILTKAGVLVVTTSSDGDGATLSPFFISFLGIISGLLAEQALETIQGVGGRWFTTSAQTDRPRWAYRLAEYLGIQNKTIETMTDKEKEEIRRLGDVLNVSSAEILNWLREEKKIPLIYQNLIAVYLRKPARDIFSDIP